MPAVMTNGLVIGTPTLDGLSVDPAITGLTGAPLADVSALTTNPQPNATAEPAAFTGEPSLVAQVFTAAFRVLRVGLDFLGVDFVTQLSPLIASDSPPWITTLGLNVQRSDVDGMPVYELAPANPSGKYVVAIHGGAYVVEPTILHWLEYAAMARDTGATVVVPIYPLAPQGTAGTVVPQMADMISGQIDQHGAENVSLYGDSAGGGIALYSLAGVGASRRPRAVAHGAAVTDARSHLQ
jgi:acetyl esterase/lipase